MLLFDDAYEHEVWYDNDDGEEDAEDRVVLLFDVWHPDVHKDEQTAIVDMFDGLQKGGAATTAS